VIAGTPSLVMNRLRRSAALVAKLRCGVARRACAEPPAATGMWSIGIYAGRSLLRLAPLRGVRNPVLTPADVTDVPAGSVADPFVLRMDRTWYMFFEVVHRETDRGQIGLAMSRDGVAWTYQHIVLAEPFHLSYPYVFQHAGEVYMIPESGEAQEVRLYRATAFPVRWSLVATLLGGRYVVDASLFHHGGRWWILADTSDEARHDTLRLFYADDVFGPWREHPESPIVEGDAHVARPAGRVLVTDGRVIRYAQDDAPTYGRQVWAFEITELTARRYGERALSRRPIISAAGAGWNGLGMHHIDAHRGGDGRWWACVDGLGLWSREAHGEVGG
jgi:hypothetical protein